MFNKKIFLSLSIFIILMVFTSIIKTQTRMIEKNIFLAEKRIGNLETNFYEAQLDYYYLTSPDYISKKISQYSNQEYQSMKYSRIYLNFDQFLEDQKKISQFFKDKTKNKKK